MRRTVWPFAVAGALLALLAILGTYQYRWLGEVSGAERDRLRASLRMRASGVAQEFDREITRTYAAFHLDGDAFDRDPAGTLSDAFARTQSLSPVGGLVRGVYLVDSRRADDSSLLQLDPANRRLVAVEWPDAFVKWRGALHGAPPDTPTGLAPLFMAEAVDSEVPALVVPVPVFRRLDRGQRMAVLPDPTGPGRGVIVWLDDARLRQLVTALVDRNFGPADASEYFVNVVKRADPSQIVYALGDGSDVGPQNADVAAGLFALRLEDLSLFNLHVPRPDGAAGGSGTPAPREGKNQFAITIVRRANGPEGARVLVAGADPDGAWQLLIRSRAGSLEALVAASRRRNLAIGLGVLGLLAVSFVFVMASAQRQRTLARQQMEFVAAVSHELRTPLAVIQSAGENLADGVVGDGDQVRRYGSLIRTEGRRLGDMVERVLEFAGITAGTAARTAVDVEIPRVIDDAIAAIEPDARDRGIRIACVVRGTLPLAHGDPAALRSAVQNVIGNAVKYSPPGSAVDIEATPDGRGVRIAVTDRGLGIDSADLPHIFKPFFRGRRAVDAQIRGTGVGLSVVRHVIDAHGGSVHAESGAGGGTTVTLVVPAGPRQGPIAAEVRTAT